MGDKLMGDKLMAFDHTFQSAAAATGNGTALDVGGLAAVGVQITGITSATITFEGTIDGTNWVSVLAANMTTGAAAATATANGIYLVAVTGLAQLRARISTYATGTITILGKGVIESAGYELVAA